MLTDIKQTRQGVIAALIPTIVIVLASGVCAILAYLAINHAIQSAVKELTK